MASKPITEHIFQKNIKEKIGNVKSEEWRFTAAFRARCCLCNPCDKNSQMDRPSSRPLRWRDLNAFLSSKSGYQNRIENEYEIVMY